MFKFLKKIFNKLPIKNQKTLNQNLKEIDKQKEIDRQIEKEYWNWVTQENLKWFDDKK